MEQFQSKFIEEATDLIDELEELLLETQIDHLPEGFIEQVFRIMHSLKGSGAMFGFQAIGDFAHNLEDMYDKIRNDEIVITERILDITLSSVDLFKGLLSSDVDPMVAEGVERVTKETLGIINNEDASVQSQARSTSVAGKQKTFWVEFIPDKDIFDNGTNPLYVVDELTGLGKTEVIVNTTKIPELGELNPTACYISWSILMATEKTKEEIDEVFMFVEDSAKISIVEIANRNVLGEEAVENHLKIVKSNPAAVNRKFIEELIELGQNAEKKQEEKKIQENLNEFNRRKQLSSIRVAADKIDGYLSLVSELVTVQTSLSILSEKLKIEELGRITEEIEHLSRNLRDNAISISLVPFATVFSRFQRLVRDLSKEFGKEIELEAEGMDTELDKSMIQTITDPLMHIIRNSIDHGIESPQEREANGKSKTGKIIMRALHSGANIVIEVIDDGKGIDPNKIKVAALRKGYLKPEVELSDEEIVKLILKPGFSTAEKTTSVSGRGVGMDVVNQNVNNLRGTLEIDSELGKGTTIRIRLPQSLSILDGMLVSIAGTLFVIPSMVLLKIAPITRQEIEAASNAMLNIEGEFIPFLNMRNEFGLDGEIPEREELVILEYESTKVALIVDQVHNEYQIVLRPLGKFLKGNDLLLGASIIGEGNISLVLDTDRIIKTVIEKQRKQ